MIEYKNYNTRPTYYKVRPDMKVDKFEASYLFELIYFKEYELAKEQLKVCVKEKEKKISRMTKLDIETLKERLFRSLVNRDKYHTVDLSNELILRSKKDFFDIMYKLSFMAEDEEKLIKTYLFELIYDKIGYVDFVMRNLIKYFVSSCPKYMNLEDKKQIEYFYGTISKLYLLVYNKKCEEYGLKKIEIEAHENLSDIKKIIYKKLKQGE